jgi:hypothetical protein
MSNRRGSGILSHPDDILTWLDTLFRPGDLFMVRLKRTEDAYATTNWLDFSKREQFARSHCDIHQNHGRNVWVGVCPRESVGSNNPTLVRVLWCDFDASITSVEQAKKYVAEAGLPEASMYVWSGNGVHGYWFLDRDYTPDEAQPHARGLHDALPTDATHDVTRIIRVPGTVNFGKKPGDEPTESHIAEHCPTRVYRLADFPRRESVVLPESNPKVPRRDLLAADRESILTSWLDGQKHRMVLATAAYLRKELGWGEKEALDEIISIHEDAGYESDEGLERAVRDTYAKPIAKVSSNGIFAEAGVVLKNRGLPSFRIVKPKPPKIEVIDFREDLQPQEFWIDGLVGPGLLTIWAAQPKLGKSQSMMMMGHALSNGLPIWDFQTDGKKHSVLYFQGELSKGMVYERARNMFGVAPIDSKWFALTAKPAEALNLIENPEPLMDLAESYEVVIIDPISVFTNSDETKSYAVNEIIGTFDRLRKMGKAVVLVHHTRKLQTDRQGNEVVPSFNDIRGSGAWFAAADALALQYRVGDSGNTEVKFQFRAAPDRDKLMLYRLPHGEFTHDKEVYRQTLPGSIRANVGDLSLN